MNLDQRLETNLEYKNSNEKVVEKLLSSLMFPDNKQQLNLSTIEGYNKANTALQKEISVVFDNLQLGQLIESKLQATPDIPEDQKIKTIADTLYEYSYSREHGGFENLFLEYVKTGEYGFNCEMSSAMVNEALTRQGYEPRLVKTKIGNEYFLPNVEHYISCIPNGENTLKVIDLYKYDRTQNSAHIFDLIIAKKENEEEQSSDPIFYCEMPNKEKDNFYIYPKDTKFDILQTLKSFDDIKKFKIGSGSDNKSKSVQTILNKYPEIKNFNLAELKTKLALTDPFEILNN